MYSYYRLFVHVCLGVALFGQGTSSAARPPRAALLAAHWQLRTFDGHRAPDWVRRPARLLLPELRDPATGAPLQDLHRPQVGACGPSPARRLLSSAHLISVLLSADDHAVRNELRYLHLLEQLNSYEISGRSLRLYDGAHPAPRLVFTLK